MNISPPPSVELPDIEFPEKLQCLFTRKRYKVLWGGRGAGRSWGVARFLLLEGVKRPIRVLCVRELQNSIAESVHKVLADQIDKLGLERFYKIEVSKITCVVGSGAGTSFFFEGIKNNTTKIKSYEGIDYCWVEEAIKVSKTSWKILIPTIRKEECPNGHKLPPVRYLDEEEAVEDGSIPEIYKCGVCGEEILQSEILMTFNPELESDYTYRRFVLNANLKNSVVVKMTHRDNPWFSRVLHDEMLEDKANDYDSYLNVWEGHCLHALEGAVYAKEIQRATKENRICKVPWDRATPVNAFFDLGRADATAIWFIQKVGLQFRVLGYFQDSLQEMSYYIRELQRREYTYDTIYLPHDAKAKRLGSKRTIEEQVRASGYRVQIVPSVSRNDGINAVRIIFPLCWFDEKECEEGIHSLRHYRYRVVEAEGVKSLSNEPVHDWASDGADAFRYFAVGMRSPAPRTKLRDWLGRPEKVTEEYFGERGSGGRNLGWLGH